MPDLGGILRDMDIPWPEANENDLREAATAWHRLAGALRDGTGRANSAAGSLTSNNEGAAIGAFENYWNKYADRRKGALPLAAEACDAMGHACTKYADEVAAVKHKIEEAGAEAGAAVAVGTVGAVFTFGAAEGAADVGAVAILDAADSVITALGETMTALAAQLSSGVVADAITAATAAIGSALVTDTAASALGAGAVTVFNGTASGVAGATLSSIANNDVRELFDDTSLSPNKVDQALEDGAIGGAAGGVLGKLAELGQAQLATLLKNVGESVIGSDAQLSMQMTELASQVEGAPGKIANEVLTKAATQLVTAQQINANKIVKDEIPNLINRAATRGDG